MSSPEEEDDTLAGGPPTSGHGGDRVHLQAHGRDQASIFQSAGDLTIHYPPAVESEKGRALTSADLARAKDVLTGQVYEQWRREAVLRSLYRPRPIPVRWQALHDQAAGSPPGEIAADSGGGVAGLAAELRRTRGRRLVILGGAGTGKTTLAVQLLLELLHTRVSESEPVPVLLPLADWDIARYERLHRWVAARLTEDYPALREPALGADIPGTLAERGAILPVLDGLDELPAPARATVIKALNRSLADDDQFVLTSRTGEFLDAEQQAGRLTSGLVVELQPLTAALFTGYLEQCLRELPRPEPAWDRILKDLRTVPLPPKITPLAEVAETVLGLGLVREVYITPDADPAPLVDGRFPNAKVLNEHLLEHLIGALIAAKPPSGDRAELFRPRRRWDPIQVHRWLGYLAEHLDRIPADDQRGTRDLAWWQLARHTLHPRTLPILAGLGLGITAGLSLGLTGGVTGISGLGARLFLGLAVVLLFSPVAAITLNWVQAAPGPAVRSWTEESPAFANFQMAGRTSLLVRRIIHHVLVRGTVYGLTWGLSLGVTFVFVLDVKGGFGTGITTGLMAGPIGGLVHAVIEWAETPASTSEASTLTNSWRRDRALILWRSLAGGLVVGVAFCVATAMAAGFSFGLTAGLIGALMFGVLSGRHHAWLAYVVTTYRLAWSRRLPRRLMPFLDDAHRLGLLRAVGPIYQFRHAELQDYLAESHRAR